MQKKVLKLFIFLAIFFMWPGFVSAALLPVLNFSDITSGPKVGIGDGLGEGAIVTVWGNNLGVDQGDSKIYFKDSLNNIYEAAYVYYWKNADGQLPGGPADLFNYQKMQEIAFSIPSDVADGDGKIYVTRSGQNSNELDFTVRDGDIYFVSSDGNNTTGDGTWSLPWATVDFYDSPTGAAGKSLVVPGSLIYVKNVAETDTVDIRDKVGSSDMPFGLISYPGSTYSINSVSNSGLQNYYPYDSSYWVISKAFIVTEGSGIAAGTGWRIIGNEITDGICADGQGGAITAYTGKGGEIKAFGNYIHDYGGSCTTSLHHVFYISNRSGLAIPAYELGWNFMIDNEARHALHIYDEGACGDFSGKFTIHNNVVVNQRGAAFNANAAGTDCITAPMDVYSNLFINNGLNPWQNYSVNVTMSGLTSHIRFYNNTIYGYSADNSSGSAIYIQDNGSTSWNFGGTYEWVNNIVVDTNNREYVDLEYIKTPTLSSNNIWYNGGDGIPLAPPDWDAESIDGDPLFVNILNNDFQLQDLSPAVNSGLDASLISSRDIIGTIRPQLSNFDIGAFEYISSDVTPPASPSGLNIL